MSDLVLSLFPGIGLLDMAFEKEGFTVVRGPDLLWSGDIRRFHPPAGRFDGVIGGPPCQDFSTGVVSKNGGRYMSEHGYGAEMLAEFSRVVGEARPSWWLAENVYHVPTITVPGYKTTRLRLNLRWLGEEQNRDRIFQFGYAQAVELSKYIELAALETPRWESCCVGSEGSRGHRQKGFRGPYAPRRPWPRFCELTGLPAGFLDHAPFTIEGKYRVVGEGVPLPMGQAMARAVKRALEVHAPSR